MNLMPFEPWLKYLTISYNSVNDKHALLYPYRLGKRIIALHSTIKTKIIKFEHEGTFEDKNILRGLLFTSAAFFVGTY